MKVGITRHDIIRELQSQVFITDDDREFPWYVDAIEGDRDDILVRCKIVTILSDCPIATRCARVVRAYYA